MKDSELLAFQRGRKEGQGRGPTNQPASPVTGDRPVTGALSPLAHKPQTRPVDRFHCSVVAGRRRRGSALRRETQRPKLLLRRDPAEALGTHCWLNCQPTTTNNQQPNSPHGTSVNPKSHGREPYLFASGPLSLGPVLSSVSLRRNDVEIDAIRYGPCMDMPHAVCEIRLARYWRANDS